MADRKLNDADAANYGKTLAELVLNLQATHGWTDDDAGAVASSTILHVWRSLLNGTHAIELLRRQADILEREFISEGSAPSDGLKSLSDAQLNGVAHQLNSVLLELGAELKLPPADLATVAAVAAVNVNVAVHGAAGVEHMRTAADVAEKQLIGCGARR